METKSTTWIEENNSNDIKDLMEHCIYNFDENLTCYQNFKELIPLIYSAWFNKGFLYSQSHNAI